MINERERLAKLPKWAQQRISDLERHVEKCEDALAQFEHTQTKSKVFYDFQTQTTRYRSYVPADKITFEHADVILEVSLHEDDRINLSWRPSGRGYNLGDICFIPHAFQQARLVNPKNSQT